MGRHAGWVALYAGIGGGADWILIPEVPVDLNAMCHYLQQVYHGGKRYGLVVVSEGVELPFAGSDEPAATDDFGHKVLKERAVGSRVARYIEEITGIETRDAVIGHIQRGGPPTVYDRVLATRLGLKAAELVSAGQFGMLAALRGVEIVAVPLEEALQAPKLVPYELYEEARQIFQRVALQPQRSGTGYGLRQIHGAQARLAENRLHRQRVVACACALLQHGRGGISVRAFGDPYPVFQCAEQVRGKRRVGLLAVDHMVQAHQRRDMPKPRNLLCDGRADFGVARHQVAFGGRQRRRLVEDVIRNGDHADVAQIDRQFHPTAFV